MTEHAPAKFLSGIDIPKTIGGVLAAITAAVLGSFLGVAGTLIGAAVASIVGSVGTELYTRFIHRGTQTIKSTFVTAPAAIGTPPVAAAEDEVPSDEEPAPAAPVKMRWGRMAALAAAVFVLAMGSLTVFELISKQTIADAVGHKTSSSTTVGWVTGDNSNSTPTPSPATSTEPSAEPTGTGAPSTEPTTAPPTTEPTADPTATTDPQQPGGTDQGTTPTDAPTTDQNQLDGTTGDQSQQNGAGTNGAE